MLRSCRSTVPPPPSTPSRSHLLGLSADRSASLSPFSLDASHEAGAACSLLPSQTTCPHKLRTRSLPLASTRRIRQTNVVALCAQRGQPPLQTRACSMDFSRADLYSRQQGWSRVFRPRQDQLPLPPRPKDVDRYHAKRYVRYRRGALIL